MLLGIDHLVIAVRDVEAAAAVLEADLGLAFTSGGRHEAMGTYNRLAFLGDTYLELIGVFDAGLVASSSTFAVGNAAMALLDSGREGLATYALATDNVAADVAALRAAGSHIASPVEGFRRRADGEEVRWSTAFPALGPARPPFLIEHAYEGAEWGPEARAARSAFRHPVGGAVRLAALELPVDDPAAVAGDYGAVLGIGFSGQWRTRVGGQVVALRMSVGDGDVPVVRLAVEAGTPPLDTIRHGIRWTRDAS